MGRQSAPSFEPLLILPGPFSLIRVIVWLLGLARFAMPWLGSTGLHWLGGRRFLKGWRTQNPFLDLQAPHVWQVSALNLWSCGRQRWLMGPPGLAFPNLSGPPCRLP
jgi:hypothetical protein